MAINSLPAKTVENMVYSAGLSCLVSAVFNKGNPLTMAAIGALAALTHACASVILKRFNLDAHALSQNTGLPIEATASLQAVLSVVLTQSIVRLLGGPAFDVAKTAIIAAGLTFLAYSNSNMGSRNIAFITVA